MRLKHSINAHPLHPKQTVDSSVEGIDTIPFHHSPHCDQRPQDTLINLLVIHNISLPPGDFSHSQHILDFFQGKLDVPAHPYFEAIQHLKVSSHFVILRQGQVIQMVPLHRRAWHAGISSFQGQANCNDYSIGIELEGTDLIPYTAEQYDALIALTHQLMKRFPAITPERIVGHSDIAPDRKTDPGPSFDWARYKSKLIC